MRDYDYDEFTKGFDELMLHELDKEEEMNSLGQQRDVHERLMTGKASHEEVESFITGYFERNAPTSIVLFDEVPLTSEERDHILNIMRSMYYVSRREHVSGHFVGMLLSNDLQAVAHADKVNQRALKLYLWFKHNELSGIRALTEVEE